MSYTELRATLPCWALAALPKVWKLFPPNFAQASQALLTQASPGPFSIFHHIFVYILNRGNVFVFTLRHHQKIKKAFQSKQVSGSVKHLVAIQAFFLVKVCFKYLPAVKSWHFATLLLCLPTVPQKYQFDFNEKLRFSQRCHLSVVSHRHLISCLLPTKDQPVKPGRQPQSEIIC